MKITESHKLPKAATSERSICEFLAASKAPHIYAIHSVRWTDLSGKKTNGIESFECMAEFDSAEGNEQALRAMFDAIRFDYLKIR